MKERSTRVAHLRLGVRLARRELRRRPARSLLVVLMVLLPTGVMTAVATYLRTAEWSAADQARAESGAADARAHPTEVTGQLGPNLRVTPERVAALRAALPAGSSVLAEHAFNDRVRLGDRRAYLQVSDLPLDHPMVEGRFGRLRGRLPDDGGETVLTDGLARDLGVGLGDRLAADRLGRSLTVVGVVRALGTNAGVAYVPGPLPEEPQLFATVFLDLPDGPLPSVPGWFLSSALVGGGADRTEGVFWSYLGGGVGLLVLGTVVAAAFAVGARRQLRTIGLLASSGASPGTVGWFLVAQGALAGLAGSVAGMAAGLVAARLTPLRLLDSFAGHPVAGSVTRLADLVPIVVIGTGAAMVAAWLPARSAARVPTLSALAGRRPLPRVPAMLPVFGVASMGTGCALLAVAVAGGDDRSSSLWALVAVGGAVAVLVGALAVAPWVVAGLERASGRWSQSWRLAGRSLARSRVRSSAVVGAICAVAATVVGTSTLYTSFEAGDGCCADALPYVREDQAVITSSITSDVTVEPAPVPPDVVARITAVVPAARFVPVSGLVPAGRPGGAALARALLPRALGGGGVALGDARLALATPELVDLFAVPPRLRAALDRGEAISVAGPARGGVVALAFGDPQPGPPPSPARSSVALGGSYESPAASSALPQVLIGPAGAARLGLVAHPTGQTVVKLAGPATDRQQRALQLLSEDLRWEEGEPRPGTGPSINLQAPAGDDDVSLALVKAALLGLALVLVLGVVAVGLALAATDNQEERQVLAAVGAPPRTLRRVGTRRAALLVLTAVAIAVPAGLLPAAAIVTAAGDGGGLLPPDDPFRVDWSVLAFVVVALPLGVAAAAAGGARLRDAFRPPRPATLAFSD